jgi:hypothetical protein
MKCWSEGKPAVVNTPGYVRDYIHVSLLAKNYALFCSTLNRGTSRLNPSGYVETHGAFTERVATQIRQRLGWDCEFELKSQVEFLEPRVRINTDGFDPSTLNWSETRAWDELANYYAQQMVYHKAM